MILNRFAAMTFMCAAIASASAGAQPARDGQPMPHALYGRLDARRPIFMEASDVLDENGNLRRDAPLTTASERDLRDFLEHAPRQNGCIQVGNVYIDYLNAPQRPGLAKTIERSDFIVEARVVNRSYGFMRGIPGQLLRLSRLSTLKGVAPDYSNYYIFVPVGNFSVGPVHFCKTDTRYGEAPAVGDRLFIFGDKEWVDNDYINTIDEKGYVRALADDRLSLPRSMVEPGSLISTGSELRRLIEKPGRAVK